VDVIQALQWTQSLLFAGLAVVALGSWWRHRNAPAAYVALAFGVLGAVTTINRISEALGVTPPEVFRDTTTTAVVLFPWFLAAFAWSFVGRLPGWLRAAGVVTLATALIVFVLPPLPDAAERSTDQQVWVYAVLALWATLSFAAASHLWRVGRAQRIVRARTRLLALGAIVLTVTLFVAGTANTPDARVVATVTSVLVIVAALLFAAGFAPPPLLRLYWRQLPSQRMFEMQTRLVAAVTPDEAVEAVVPVLADTLGAGAICVAPDGHVVAHAGLDDAAVDRVRERLLTGDVDQPGLEVERVDGWYLAVQTSPYAPLFGDDERSLLGRFAMQLRLALQRAELFVALRRTRDQLEEAGRDLQSMLVGLAHDLRSPAVTISTYAALLPDAVDPDDQALMLEGLRDGSAYLDRLVDGLLSLSRIGRNDGEPEPVDLESVVAGVTRRLAAAHPDLTVTTDGRLPTLQVDRLRIEQVFDNLLGNAAKHGGRHDLSVHATWTPGSGGGGVITLADDGRGVPEAEREVVFGLFRRGSTAAAGSGVGLGLVRRVVESLGGSVRFAPSDLGARVEITIPEGLVGTNGTDAAEPQTMPSRERSS
jgi:signal transduction histidine kinase